MKPNSKMNKKKAYIIENQRFLEANAQKEGVVVHPSGIQYRILHEGTGAMPSMQSVVQVYYTGSLIDGKVFDSNITDLVPVAFRLRDLIVGWQKALLMMPVGSKWEIVIPAELAYDDQSMDGIPKYSTLIFEVELLGLA